MFWDNCKKLVTNLCAITVAIKRESSTKSASAITYYYIVLAADYNPPAGSQTPCLVELSCDLDSNKRLCNKKVQNPQEVLPWTTFAANEVKTWYPVLFRFSLEKPIKNV